LRFWVFSIDETVAKIVNQKTVPERSKQNDEALESSAVAAWYDVLLIK